MRYVLMLLTFALVLPLTGCCQSWDWYNECDLVEGGKKYHGGLIRTGCNPECHSTCETPCGPRTAPCTPGVVVQSAYGIPADPQATTTTTVVEDGPQAGDIVATELIEVAPGE